MKSFLFYQVLTCVCDCKYVPMCTCMFERMYGWVRMGECVRLCTIGRERQNLEKPG